MIGDREPSYHGYNKTSFCGYSMGNHDIVWMGAAAGSEACMRMSLEYLARYANLDTIEDGYGINILLSYFCHGVLSDDECLAFMPKVVGNNNANEKDAKLIAKCAKRLQSFSLSWKRNYKETPIF